MPKISEEEQNKIRNMFEEQMTEEVNILFFESDSGCDYCDDTKEILDEISSLHENINLSVYNIEDKEAEKYNIHGAPATVFLDAEKNDLGVYFFGIPSGYEFNTLIEDIIDISNMNPELSDEVISAAKEIDEEVNLQVFITPTCPYCPRSVRVAHQLAMVNPKIRGEMIEAIEFQELSNKYNVSGVPKTVINQGKAEQVGAVPAKTIIDKIKEVI